MMNYPKYESYKDSGIDWLGEIPSDWNLVKLKMLIREHSGNGFPIEYQGQKGNIPFLKVSDISATSGNYVEQSINYICDKTAVKNKWNCVPRGSIVTAKIGEALRKNHRKILNISSVIDNNCLGIESTGMDIIFSFYLHTVIDFDWFVNPGAVPSISMAKYRNFKISLPSIAEQSLIAKFLDQKTSQIDEAISIKEKQIELLKEQKQIMIQNSVTKGLDPNVKMKDSGVDWIGEIPEHWEVVANRTLFNERKESGNENLPLLSVSIHTGVSNDEIPEEDNIRGKIKIEDKSKYLAVKPNDIVFNMMRAWQGGIGAVATNGMVSPAYIVACPNKKLSAIFFELQYRAPEFIQQMNRSSKGITDFRKRLYWNEFKQLLTILPPKNEQEDIIKIIQKMSENLEEIITVYLKQIDKLKEYKTTLINSAVTGKIKVTPEMVGEA